MNIALPKAQAEWLAAKVADGTFSSIDEAIAQMIEVEMYLDHDELDWAHEAVAVARRDVAEGRTLSLDDHRARNAARLARLGG